jgi:CubicO group peptidase (beta-lactamase class C family)
MCKLLRFLSILMILTLFTAACNQAIPSPFPTQVSSDPVVQARIDQFDQAIQKASDEVGYPFSGSIIIFQDDSILINKGYGFADRARKIPNDANTRFHLGYITMTYIATAIYMLYDQGKLDLQEQACEYIENCPESLTGTTVQDLLDSNYDLSYDQLKKIVETASGLDFEEFLKKNILRPLGLVNTGVIHGQGNADHLALQYKGPGETDLADLQDSANIYGARGMYSTAEDTYTFLQALLQRKILNGEKVTALTEGKDLISWWTRNNNRGSGWENNPGYFHLTWQAEMGSNIFFDPGSKIGVILLVNQIPSLDNEVMDIVHGEYE